MIASKIDSLLPEQLMTHFEFYLINEGKQYALYKNNKNVFVFLYKSKDEDDKIRYLETISFNSLDQLDFFLFMTSNLEKGPINQEVIIAIKI